MDLTAFSASSEGIVHALNTLSPMGLVALLSFIIWQLVSPKSAIRKITDNHMSSLPEIVSEIQKTNAILLEIHKDTQQTRDDMNYVKARVS